MGVSKYKLLCLAQHAEPWEEESKYIDQTDLTKNTDWEQVKIATADKSEYESIHKIISSFPDAFSNNLPKQPAKVTPLSFTLDKSKWMKRSNQEPARRQTLQKEEVIQTMTDELTATGVISPSPQAEAWSQVHLVRKPTGKWRYCIDFRRLNVELHNRGWPLPRIQELIARIGNTKPKYFGKIDLLVLFCFQVNLCCAPPCCNYLMKKSR